MNWKSLDYGPITKAEITEYVKDPSWQRFRIEMLGTSLETKYAMLKGWLAASLYSREAQVQVTNYYNALKRGGQIK